jgi:sulfate transport system substrate-binding protein
VKRILILVGAVLLAITLAGFNASADNKTVELLNASYDVSRELFAAVNPVFAAQWKAKTGQTLVIRQSHAGSSKQARAVAEGLRADIITFNQETDVDLLRRTGSVAADWRTRLPDRASPYYSLPVFLVRSGNPKRIKDWNDLARPDVQVVFPNPKTSGNGRYSYLGAYAYALRRNDGDAAKAGKFVQQVLKNVPVFDTGGRGATTTFIERQIGDVLITFESEVHAIKREYARSTFDTVVPSMSIRADFPVAVVDRVVDRHGTREVATAYLQFLYSDAGQEILAKNFFRVRNRAVASRYRAQFPEVQLISIDDAFGGWDEVMETHFGDGGVLDRAVMANR